MDTSIRLFSLVYVNAFIRSIAFIPPNLIIARLAFAHDLDGLLLFGLSALLTQIIATKISFILVKKKMEFTKLNRIIVVLSAISTLILAIHYLNGGKQEVFHLSRFPVRCICLILSGVFTTLLSSIRLPGLQQHISLLKCKQLLNSGKGERHYFTGVILGTISAALVYISLGYLLSLHWLSGFHSFNYIIGMMLIIVTVKRVWQMISQIKISCSKCAVDT